MKKKIASQKSQVPTYERLISLDIFRSIAIILMLVAHVTAATFDHVDDSNYFYKIGVVGGTVCFTAFLLLSAASYVITYLSIDSSDKALIRSRKIKLLNKTLQLILVYYLISFVYFLLFNLKNYTETEDILLAVSRIFLLQDLTIYAEFLLAFVGFNLLVLLFRGFFKTILKYPPLGLLVSIGTYLSGYLLYNDKFKYVSLNNVKALFVGHGEVHSFPILQYFFIFITGLYLGKLLTSSISKKFKAITLGFLSLSFLALTIASSQFYDSNSLEILNTSSSSGRFPPMIGFLVLSLFISSTLLFVSYLLELAPTKKIHFLFEYLSKRSLMIMALHVIFLFLFVRFKSLEGVGNTWKFTNEIDLVLTFLLILISTLIVGDILLILGRFIPSKKLLTKVIHLLFSLLVILSMGFYIYHYLKSPENRQIEPDIIYTSRPTVPWLTHDYFGFYQLNLDSTVSQDTVVFFNFDHKKLITEGQSSSTKGFDLQVFHLSKNGKYQPLPFQLKNVNINSTKVYFKVPDPSEKYFLYYGNYSQLGNPNIKNNIESKSALSINLGSQFDHQLKVTTDRKWYLKQGSEKNKVTLTVKVSDKILNPIGGYYRIEGTDIKGVITKKDILKKEFQITNDISKLNAGKYKVSMYVIDHTLLPKIKRSQNQQVNISYPLYVTWTIDWEGWGVSSGDLNEITGIADKHKIPLTHFFNPRIFVKEQFSIYQVSPESAKYFTNWVLQRKAAKGDEIGLHLHFYPDLLKEVDVDVRANAKLVGINRDETYIQGYSMEELEKILDWSLDKFSENGLPKPISFRSGAWMSDEHVLVALANKGFLIDSSGRTPGILNPAWRGSTPIPWNLKSTTKPYKPSTFDINSWNGSRINIFEFPNNGADSYWFNENDLKKRFDENFPKKSEILSSPQTLTYLSHPHGFTVYDSKKIKQLFEYIDNFKYENDAGPVIFTTLEGAYQKWDKDNFINGE